MPLFLQSWMTFPLMLWNDPLTLIPSSLLDVTSLPWTVMLDVAPRVPVNWIAAALTDVTLKPLNVMNFPSVNLTPAVDEAPAIVTGPLGSAWNTICWELDVALVLANWFG